MVSGEKRWKRVKEGREKGTHGEGREGLVWNMTFAARKGPLLVEEVEPTVICREEFRSQIYERNEKQWSR